MTTTIVIDEFVAKPTPATMDRLIAVFKHGEVMDEDIAYLTVRMSESGESIRHEDTWTADVPSTGGPSSLSTLLCPLQLVRGGATVPKLGVPGRPAGGIDVLACIPGFRTNLTRNEIARCLVACRYAHFLADETFVPIDAVLFEYRRKTNTTHVPTLAIASLLSKKLALGVRSVSLDVRVAPFTNFGSTWDEARQNATRFIRVAGLLGIRASCFLTDAAAPYQRFIGRGESLVALKRILSGDVTEDLAAHLELCNRISRVCLPAGQASAPTDLQVIFANHLKQQGTSWDNFVKTINDVESQKSGIIFADSNGYLGINLACIRDTLVTRQEERKQIRNPFPDPCGLTLLVSWGTAVQRGDPVAKVRSSRNLAGLLEQLRPHIFQSVHPPVRHTEEMVSGNG